MKNRKYTHHLHGHANKLRRLQKQRTMVLCNGFQRMPARRNFEGDKRVLLTKRQELLLKCILHSRVTIINNNIYFKVTEWGQRHNPVAEGLLSICAAWGSILSTITMKKIKAREKMNMLTDLAGENHILSWKWLQFRSVNKKSKNPRDVKENDILARSDTTVTTHSRQTTAASISEPHRKWRR